MLMLLGAVLALTASVELPDTAVGRDSTPAERFEAIGWGEPGTRGALGTVASVHVPDGCRFTGERGARTFMELTQNPPGLDELGVMVCSTSDAHDPSMWFVVFTYREIGYVRDDEKDALDAEAMLAAIKRGTEAANARRAEAGWERLKVIGWERQPYYDPRTNHLTYAIRGGSGSSVSINHSVRLLGRKGVMELDLVVNPEEKASALPVLDSIVAGFAFRTGQQYSEWTTGDRVADVGLTGLVVGGAAVAAAKTGLLGQLGKLVAAAGKAIVLAVIAALAGIKSLLTRRRQGDASTG